MDNVTGPVDNRPLPPPTADGRWVWLDGIVAYRPHDWTPPAGDTR